MESPPLTLQQKTFQEVYSDRFLVRYPWTGPIISVMYLILVKVLQKYMENRPAYNLLTTMRIYNVIQVLICGKLVLKFFTTGLWLRYLNGTICPPEDLESSFYTAFHDIALLYTILKVVDLSDTVFIILRKKGSHLSFLHLFHHCSMVGISCFGYYEGEGLGIPGAVLNSYVHMVMYTYYLVSSFERQRWISKYKKHITQLQIMQFIAIGVYTYYAIYAGCHWKPTTIIIGYIVLSVLIYEFVRFYVTSYIKIKRK